MKSPFEVHDSRLCSLSSGATADEADNINCDTAEDVGHKIMKSMDDSKFTELTMKKSNQIRNLACLRNQCHVGKKTINIDPNILFSRLLILVERSADIPPYFAYELTPVRVLCSKTISRERQTKLLLQSI